MEYFSEYHATILAVGLVGGLMFIQLIIVDVIALVKKHVSGYPVENSHSQLLFRVTLA